MTEVTVHIVQAFVAGDRGGNPAGVVLDAGTLTAAQKQAVAAQVGYSETAFVSPSTTADFKLDFFTPTRQIAHCGHATIGTFSYLVQSGRLRGTHSSKETIDGRREIILRGDMAFMQQSAPRYAIPAARAPRATTAAILYALALDGRHLLDGREPLVVSTGVRFVLVPLRDATAVRAVQPDLAAIATLSEALDAIGFYVFSRETEGHGRDAGARMFAPAYGIPEESATGMAAGPLACYLYDRLGIRQARFVVEQGYLMTPPSPSLLTAELQLVEERIEGLMVGGRGVVSHAMRVTI